MLTVLSLPPQYVVVIVGVCLCLGNSEAQVTRPQGAPSLQGFFDAIVQRSDQKHLPGTEEVMRAVDQTGSMPSQDIAKALPSILRAFRYEDDTVRGYAALAMYAIGERSDGAELLKPYSKLIAKGLDLRKPQLQGVTLQLLAVLKLDPQSETVSSLVKFVRRPDRDLVAQTSAFSLLLQIAPENPDLIPALQDLVARPMDEQAKEALINGIANSHTENVIATDVLIGALADPSEGVRFQAAQGIQRIPEDMAMRAKPALQGVLSRPDESEEVKKAAKDALRAVGPEQ